MSRRHVSIVATSALLIAANGAAADDPAATTQARGAPDDEQASYGLFFDSRVREGLQISPVTLNLRGKNGALVGLGSYLVNAAAVTTTVTPIRRLPKAAIRSKARLKYQRRTLSRRQPPVRSDARLEEHHTRCEWASGRTHVRRIRDDDPHRS